MSATSASPEDALARAKAIAAKLSGAGASATDTASTNKRTSSRWGMTGAATATTTTTASATALSTSVKKAKTGQDSEKVSKRIWVSTTEERPAAHFRAFMGRHLPAVLAQIDKDDDKAACSVELQGRGSGGKPPPPGMPLEPLHILLQGTHAQLSQAEPMVENLLQQAEEAPIEEEAIRLDKEAEENKKYQLATTGTNNGGLSSYRPASVALLIGQANNPNAHAENQGPWIDTSIDVPTGLVGYIIGKGGENVARIQAQTGARLQIQREAELQPGQTTRTISVSAPTEQAAADCKRFIENIVADKTRQMGGGGGGGGGSGGTNGHSKDMQRVQEAIKAGHEHVIVKVPDADVGLVIGKAGATIKSLQDRTGASIQVLPASDGDGMRTVNVTHPETSGALQAKAMIEDILKNKEQKSTQERVPQTTMQVMIPDSDVGLCIGRGGSVIRHMQQVTNTRIQIPSQCNPGEMHRVATVAGPEDGCKQVQKMIQRIITEQSSAGVMSGQPPSASHHHHHYQQQQPQQPTEGQQGYTAEWAAYHAAQAAAAAQQQQQQQAYRAPMHQQQQQQQQMPGQHYQQQQAYGNQLQHAAQAPAPAGQAANDTYYEQYFRYEYYYGTEAARKHYGAWSPPVGMKNPYGDNPNPLLPAPTASTPAAAAPTPAAAAPTAAEAAPGPAAAMPATGARETSRRMVSNLPAWMTKK